MAVNLSPNAALSHRGDHLARSHSPESQPESQPEGQPASLPVKHYDVVVVGGGIVGLTFACGLRNSELQIAVIEAQTAEQAAGRERAYAFSPVSAKILEGLGLWASVGPKLTHFQQVKLSDADYPKAITFHPEDGRGDAVYYSAEHQVLMGALQEAVGSASNIDYWCETQLLLGDVRQTIGPAERPSEVSRLQVIRGNERYIFQTRLVVGADGARSGVRDRAQIDTFGWKYWQSCITAVLEPEKSHRNTAYEKFWPSGPFAILPLPNNRCQIVWTAPHEEAKAML
ncbi:MAG: NAD(P)-binding protein, partial [Cyanobacteria bacterium J06623_5]